MKVAIIGAGICGLTAGYHLSQKGHQVTVFEKQKFAGGLAAGFKKKGWQWSIEYFPHHFFVSDQAAQKLIKKLGLNSKLFYTRPKTSIFWQNKIFQFDSPLSVLSSPVFSPGQKIRLGLVTTYLKLISSWKGLEKSSALDWLNQFYGQKVNQILWQPLLENKFGQFSHQIAMSWFWARVKCRSPRLGYLRGGFQTLVDRLITRIKENSNQIILNHEVKNIAQIKKQYSKIIITTPTSTFLKIAPNFPKTFQKKAQKLKTIGALSLLLILKEKFLKDKTYWLNINETSFPFVFVDEHTNFTHPRYYDQKHLLYVGGYYPQNHRYFKMSKNQLLKEFLPSLKRINPSYNFSLNTLEFTLHTNLYAQPIVFTNYSTMILNHQTPFKNVFLANMEQVYPWDRGVNHAIQIGEKIAKIVNQD